MDSNGDKETGKKIADGNTKVDVKELQHALDVLAKYGIIKNPKQLLEQVGVKMKSVIIAKVRGKDGEIKKTYEYENGKLMEE